MAEAGLRIEKQVSIWNRPLKADFKELFKALGGSIEHAATLNWPAITGDAINAITAVGFEKDPGQLAWLLIRRALTQASYDVTYESLAYFKPDKKDDEFLKDVGDLLDAYSVLIDSSFFARPADLPFVSEFANVLADWLKTRGVADPHALPVIGRFRTYFVFALNDEWRRNRELYAPVKEAIETPFTTASERESAWRWYRAKLDRLTSEPMLGEPYGLRSVFVPLRAYYRSRPVSRLVGERSDAQDDPPTVVDLHATITNWVAAGDPNDAIRLITGGPGSGKSSFARILAADEAATQRVHVIFVPLHQLDLADDLSASVADFIKTTGILSYDPLAADSTDRLLLVFDGLDELSKQGKVGLEIAQQFVRDVERLVDQRNLKGLRLQVLITGREVTVQSQAASFKRPGQILHVLPYFVIEADRAGYADPNKLLEADQRNDWWRLYGTISGRGYEEFPEALKVPDLDEVTAQPLLNYLVALSLVRGKLDFAKAPNLNAIYADLLLAVYERGYERRQFTPIKGMEYEDFVRILEEIGLSAWHGDGRTTSVKEIEDHCRKSNLSKMLDSFKEGAEAGVTRLLTAFYFREFGQRREGDKTFEFTHKSFGEYLTARRLIRALRRIDQQRRRRMTDIDDGWSEVDALKNWIELCGPTAIDPFLAKLLRNEVALQNTDVLTDWHGSLTQLVEWMFAYGMPVDEVTPRAARFATEAQLARNASETLFVALNACARARGVQTQIRWPKPESLSGWLSTLKPAQTGDEWPEAMLGLSHLDLTNCVLDFRNLYRADFTDSTLTSASIDAAYFGEARFERTTAQKIAWSFSLIFRAAFVQTNFSFCQGVVATFFHSEFDHVQFDGGQLRQSVFVGSQFKHVTFDAANIKWGNFDGAELSDSSFVRAFLAESRFCGATLRNCDFTDATLIDADFRRATIEDCIFHGADVTSAIFPEGFVPDTSTKQS